MKATDLQIGDIVCFATRPFIIDGISVGGGSVHSDREGWQPTSEITPYPLTPEILEKNGFKWDGSGLQEMMFATDFFAEGQRHLIYVGFKHKTIDLHTSFPEERKPNWRKSNKMTLEVCDLSVHTLQHALNLCGIDKEIIIQ